MSHTPYFLQVKYAKIFGASLDLFKVKNHDPFLADARCVECGDSKTNKSKKRFYLYTKGQDVLCICHNCGYATNLEKLLRIHAEHLYKQLLVERYRFDTPLHPQEEKKEVKKKEGNWQQCLTPLMMSASAVAYMEKRQVPKKHFGKLFYTKNMKISYLDICTELHIEPEIDKQIPEIEGVFFPFLYEDHLVFSAVRNMDTSSSLRYVTLEYQPAPKIFGLEHLNLDRKIVVVEGPIDSLFISNCVATSDASITKVSSVLPRDNLIMFPDNEPRHPVQVGRIGKIVKAGYETVLLPHSIKEKDPNDLHKAGYNVDELIKKYSYKGLQAQLAFNQWKLI
jgi:hypothetical protein